MFDVPIALFAYNRPQLTRQVWDTIKQMKPKRLFVVADGPGDPSDDIACRQVRSLVDEIDWECALETDFASEHLGCGARVASGLNWVFGKVDKAIILEDDTLPDPSFFQFCRDLLERYENEETVMQIGGTNMAGTIDCSYSYGFSKFVLPPWGWASWARAWEKYDFVMGFWEEEQCRIQQRLGSTFPVWQRMITNYKKHLLSWDLQWNVAMWRCGGVSAIPSGNLVSNIGWGEDATFTRWGDGGYGNMTRAQCSVPLRHPTDFAENFDDVIEPRLFHLFEGVSYRSAES